MLAEQLTSRQQTVAIVLAVVMIIAVFELVRRHKLREEYAFLWIATAAIVTVLALWTDVLTWFMELIGAMTPASTLFFGALIFLMLLCLQFSIRLTKINHRNKQLSQRIALLERELRDLAERKTDVVGKISEGLRLRHGKALPPTGTGKGG